MDLLTYVLKNSFITFEGTHCHQVFGCAMGSPVSAVIAELVMQEVEEIALDTSSVKPRWRKRYVDNSNPCLKTKEIHVFHDHLNSVNPTYSLLWNCPHQPKIKLLPFLTNEAQWINQETSLLVYTVKPLTPTSTWISLPTAPPKASGR